MALSFNKVTVLNVHREARSNLPLDVPLCLIYGFLIKLLFCLEHCHSKRFKVVWKSNITAMTKPILKYFELTCNLLKHFIRFGLWWWMMHDLVCIWNWIPIWIWFDLELTSTALVMNDSIWIEWCIGFDLNWIWAIPISNLNWIWFASFLAKIIWFDFVIKPPNI